MTASVVFPAVVAFMVTLAVLLLALRSKRLRLALSDQPNERSLHKLPTPRFGGLGLLAGVMAGLASAGIATGISTWPLHIGAAYLALALGSAVDDRRSLPASLRMLMHLLVAAVWGAASGMPWSWIVILAFGMTWAMNLYNFMDGADGLAGGMAVVGLGTFAIAALSAEVPGAGADIALVSLTIGFAALAFLCLNFPPARLFMGDAGSIPLGFSAAALGLRGWQTELWSPLFPFIVFFPFVFDATLTLIRRLVRGERIWQAHRQHLYQRLVLAGMSHRAMTLRAYCAMIFCATVALIGRNFTIWIETLIIAVQLSVGLFLAVRIVRLDAQERDRP